MTFRRRIRTRTREEIAQRKATRAAKDWGFMARASKSRSYIVDTAYLDWCRRQPCACGGRDPRCKGPSQAHHTIKRDDRSGLPLSEWCHLEGWHGLVGGRKGWLGEKTIAERTTWGSEQVALHRALYEHEMPPPPVVPLEDGKEVA